MAASTIAGGLEGCGPSQPLPAVNRPHFTAPTERTPTSSRGSASHGLDCFRAESCSPLGRESPSRTNLTHAARLSLCQPKNGTAGLTSKPASLFRFGRGRSTPLGSSDRTLLVYYSTHPCRRPIDIINTKYSGETMAVFGSWAAELWVSPSRLLTLIFAFLLP